MEATVYSQVLILGSSMPPTATVMVSPGIALLAGLCVVAVLAVLFFPKWGLVPRLREVRRVRARVRLEDALKHLYHALVEGRQPTLESVAGAMGATQNVAAETLSELQEAELLNMNGTAMRLTPAGERYALNIIRAHRLWEKHLAEQTGVAESQWHPQAEHQEHFITPQQANILAAELGNPPFDPHGDPIPDAQGDYVRLKGKPLSSMEPGVWVRVLHLEDEPEHVHAQIRAIGLCPGMRVRVLEKTHSRLRIWCDGEEHVLAPIVAANISGVVLPDAPPAEEKPGIPLSKVTPGQRARVLHISERCRGAERRRLMDLGILPGTVLCGELRSPAGELTAYRVREALIALRREQADLIQVIPEEKTAA